MNVAVTKAIDNLRDHPIAFAFIVIIVIFQAAQVWILRDVANNNRDRFTAQDKLLSQIADNCYPKERR